MDPGPLHSLTSRRPFGCTVSLFGLQKIHSFFPFSSHSFDTLYSFVKKLYCFTYKVTWYPQNLNTPFVRSYSVQGSLVVLFLSFLLPLVTDPTPPPWTPNSSYFSCPFFRTGTSVRKRGGLGLTVPRTRGGVACTVRHPTCKGVSTDPGKPKVSSVGSHQ